MIIRFDDRFYRELARIAHAVESIDRTLKAPPEDFASEDQAVNKAAQDLLEAKERIPHGT